jgi:hypothetical protein
LRVRQSTNLHNQGMMAFKFDKDGVSDQTD